MALTDLTRISTSGIATGTSMSGAILHGDAHFRGSQVGVNSAIFDSSENELNLKDNVKLTFGDVTNGDLRIYHDTSNGSYIREAGPGALRIQGDAGVWIQSSSDNQDRIVTNHNGDVQLFYSGNKKFQTTSSGVSIGGTTIITSASGGKLGIGTNVLGYSTADDLTIATSGSTGITIRTGTTNQGNIYFADGTSGASQYAGLISYNHNTNHMFFGTADGTERLRIGSTGITTIKSPSNGEIFRIETSAGNPGGTKG